MGSRGDIARRLGIVWIDTCNPYNPFLSILILC